jgi:hypothetical protein
VDLHVGIYCDILLRHRLKKHLEDTRRHVEKGRAHLAVTTVGRPWPHPVSLRLLKCSFYRLRVLIYVVVSCRFDPRIVVHPLALYKQSPCPQAEAFHSIQKSHSKPEALEIKSPLEN